MRKNYRTQVFKDSTAYHFTHVPELSTINYTHNKAFVKDTSGDDLDKQVAVKHACREAQLAYWQFVAKECETLVGFQLT